MCFFDQHKFQCGDWKWGHFRQHCNREYRTGETCGMKLIMTTVYVSEKCKICDKIATKQRRKAAELERISRWRKEGTKFSASIDRSAEIVKTLEKEINDLLYERQRRLQAIGS
jgi:septal ring factor EnvC (AmiA/AmiB activator)